MKTECKEDLDAELHRYMLDAQSLRICAWWVMDTLRAVPAPEKRAAAKTLLKAINHVVLMRLEEEETARRAGVAYQPPPCPTPQATPRAQVPATRTVRPNRAGRRKGKEVKL